MKVVKTYLIEECIRRHADSKIGFETLVKTMRGAKIENLNELKNYFRSVDVIGNDRAVFNVRGNNYRLVAVVLIRNQTVYIRFAGSHAAYDKIDANTV